jgi:multiple sugar transport system permease protein
MGYKASIAIRNALIYAVLTIFALAMLFPFFIIVFTSLKVPSDTFRYPPTMLPREQRTVQIPGRDEPAPLYQVRTEAGQNVEWALVEENIRVGQFAPLSDANNPDALVARRFGEVKTVQGKTFKVGSEDRPVYTVQVNGQPVEMVVITRTALGRFVNPVNPDEFVLANVRLSQPADVVTARWSNYSDVVSLLGFDRALTNTALITILTVIGQIVTSVLGGYAFARLQFPGRDQLFVLYLGTIMIPFTVLIIPLYQLMVLIGWVNKIPALIIPWLYTAYGTFLMRQFFITVPKEIEEAALIDGASRWEILRKIFIPASVPALATLSTFTFLYAWNSFFWPLVIVNTGNSQNQVLTLALNVLRGRASDSPNLILAGAAIAVIPPTIVFILAQRYYVESVTSSGVKG